MTIRSQIREVITETRKNVEKPGIGLNGFQATDQIISILNESLPAKLEFTDSKQGCGCGVCRQVEIWNKCIEAMQAKINEGGKG